MIPPFVREMYGVSLERAWREVWKELGGVGE